MTTRESEIRVVHRSGTGRTYRGIPMHAAGGVHEHALALLLRGGVSSGRVLDVGCGSGALSARLADAAFDVVGADLDISDYVGPGRAVRWDAAAPTLAAELEPNSFDAVCAIEIIEHVENPMQALRNFRALLRPGGLLVISTPHIGHPRSRVKFLMRGIPSYFGPGEYFATGHRTMIPDWMLRIHVGEAGFEATNVSYGGQLGLTGKGRWLWPLAKPILDRLGMLPRDRADDGCVTFVSARRPSSRQGTAAASQL